MKNSFTKIVKKFEKKRKKGKNVFLIIADSNKAVMSGLHEDTSLETLLVYKRNAGIESLTGFINSTSINEDESTSILLDLEDENYPSIYFENTQNIERLGEDLDDILVIFCEFEQYSFFFYIFNTKETKIGMKIFNQHKLSSTQFFKHSFLNVLPRNKQTEIALLLFPTEENLSKENSYDGN